MAKSTNKAKELFIWGTESDIKDGGINDVPIYNSMEDLKKDDYLHDVFNEGHSVTVYKLVPYATLIQEINIKAIK